MHTGFRTSFLVLARIGWFCCFSSKIMSFYRQGVTRVSMEACTPCNLWQFPPTWYLRQSCVARGRRFRQNKKWKIEKHKTQVWLNNDLRQRLPCPQGTTTIISKIAKPRSALYVVFFVVGVWEEDFAKLARRWQAEMVGSLVGCVVCGGCDSILPQHKAPNNS